MPEPVEAAQSQQSDQTAATPPTADKPETTTQAKGESEASEFKSIADLLDIPAELRDQIIPKQQEPVEEKPVESELPEEAKVDLEKQEEVEEDVAEEDEEEEKPEPQQPQKIDKRLKRINRLTRQKSELEDKLDSTSNQLQEARELLQKFQKQAPVGTVPKVGPWMPDKQTADDYADLSQKKVLAKAKVEWCEKHRDGVSIVENGQEKFVDADEIGSWRREAQESLMEITPQLTMIERESKNTFKQQRASYDQLAVQFWPELADKRSETYQLAASILEEYPATAASPSANYAVGLLIEGMKSLQARAQKGNGKIPPAPAPPRHKDIDERVFTTPRVPIAPHTPEPPTRESSSSSHKKLEEATNSFMNDPDGSVESLAKVFAARDAAAKRPASRSPVTR